MRLFAELLLLSQILTLPCKNQKKVQPSLCVRGWEKVCVCAGDVLPPVTPPPPVFVSVCGAEAAVWLDVLPRWPQRVYSSFSAVSKERRRNSHLFFLPERKPYSEVLGVPVVVFQRALTQIFLTVCVKYWCLSSRHHPPGQLLPVLSHLFTLLPFSRQNQLKDQVQQALVSPGQLPEESECLTVPKYKRDLVQKLKILRQELSQQQPQAGHCRIEVSREEIFEVRMEKYKLMLSQYLCLHRGSTRGLILHHKDTLKYVHYLTQGKFSCQSTSATNEIVLQNARNIRENQIFA